MADRVPAMYMCVCARMAGAGMAEADHRDRQGPTRMYIYIPTEADHRMPAFSFANIGAAPYVAVTYMHV